MFNKGKVTRKQQRMAILAILKSLSSSYLDVTKDAITDSDEEYLKEYREYTINIREQAELSLTVLNDKLFPIDKEDKE